MKTLFPIIMLLVATACTCAQDTLDTTVRVLEETTVTFGEVVVKDPEVVELSKTVTKAPAQQIDVTSENVTVVDLASGLSSQPNIVEGKLMMSEPGSYLVIDGDAIITPVEIKEPEPEFDFTQEAKSLADAVNDQTTRLALATVYENGAKTDYIQDYTTLANTVKAMVVSNVFSKRQGQSLYADWVNGFQRPLQKSMDAAGIDTVPEYQAALKQIVKGLREGFESRILKTNCANGSCTSSVYWVKSTK